MSYEELQQKERDLTEAIWLLIGLGNTAVRESVGGFSKLLHAELYLRDALQYTMDARMDAEVLA